MNGYGSHTFKMVNIDDEAVYVKFHFKVTNVMSLAVIISYFRDQRDERNQPQIIFYLADRTTI